MDNVKKIQAEQIDDKQKILLQEDRLISNSHEILETIRVNEEFLFDGVMLGICVKGESLIHINHQEYKLGMDMITFISPNTIVKIEQVSDDFNWEIMLFSWDGFFSVPLRMEKDVFIKMNEKPVLQLDKKAVNNIIELHRFILNYHQEKLVYKDAIVNSLMSAIMFEITSYYKIETDRDALKELSREDNIARTFFSLLNNSFRQEKKLDFYAKKLCLTSNYLSYIVKKVTGSSFQKWMQTVIVIDAKNLLKTTDLSIVQISDILGFPNPSFFGRFFKQHVGLTPLQYRNVSESNICS